MDWTAVQWGQKKPMGRMEDDKRGVGTAAVSAAGSGGRQRKAPAAAALGQGPELPGKAPDRAI